MFSGPRFTKPTHSYGQLPENDPVTDAEMVALFTGPDDEDWAGKGFDKSYEEPGQ